MNFELKPINSKELKMVLDLFKEAALSISKKNIDHWQYWKTPPLEKVNWVKSASLERRWTNQINIYIEEEQIIGRWNNESIMNSKGKFFARKLDK